MSYTVWRLVVCEKDPNDGFMSAMPWMIAAVLVPSSVETLTHSPQVTGFPYYPPESFICVLCLTSPSWQVFLGQEQLPLSSFIHIPCDFTVLLASTDFTAQIWNDCYCHHLLLFSSLHRTFVFFCSCNGKQAKPARQIGLCSSRWDRFEQLCGSRDWVSTYCCWLFGLPQILEKVEYKIDNYPLEDGKLSRNNVRHSLLLLRSYSLFLGSLEVRKPPPLPFMVMVYT